MAGSKTNTSGWPSKWMRNAAITPTPTSSTIPAVAAGSSGSSHFFFIVDMVDNAKMRSPFLVHRVVEPASLKNGTLAATPFTFRYPDGPHNAETLLVNPTTLRIYVVTKDTKGGAVYQAPAQLSTSGVYTLSKVASAPATLSDGARVGRAVDSAVWSMNSCGTVSVGATPVTFGLPQPGESITPGYTAGTVYTGEEGVRSRVWRVTLP